MHNRKYIAYYQTLHKTITNRIVPHSLSIDPHLSQQGAQRYLKYHPHTNVSHYFQIRPVNQTEFQDLLTVHDLDQLLYDPDIQTETYYQIEQQNHTQSQIRQKALIENQYRHSSSMWQRLILYLKPQWGIFEHHPLIKAGLIITFSAWSIYTGLLPALARVGSIYYNPQIIWLILPIFGVWYSFQLGYNHHHAFQRKQAYLNYKKKGQPHAQKSN